MIELLVLGATLTIAAWATGAEAHRRNAASRALDRYARSRSLVFAPAPSSPRGASPRVLGSKDRVAYVVDLYRLGGEMRTRISATTERGRAAVLSVSQRGAFGWEAEPALCMGDAAFDRRFLVTTGAAADMEGLLPTLPAMLVLADRAAGVWLRSDGWRVTLSWRGMETDPIALDAAREAVVMLAGSHRPESPYR